jgi:hypothetical protein
MILTSEDLVSCTWKICEYILRGRGNPGRLGDSPRLPYIEKVEWKGLNPSAGYEVYYILNIPN